MQPLLFVLCFLIGAPLAQAADVDRLASRTIVLVRHGNYVADDSVDEKIGPHLSSLGVAQAYLAGARLAGIPTTFNHLYVSPMQRARDTAAAIAPEFPRHRFEVVDDLAECTPPTRNADIMAREKPADLAACKEKLDRDFDHFFKPAAGGEQFDLLVCHGNVIRYLTTRALGVDSKAWLEMSVGHASITTIRVEADGTFKVISVGDVGHIPPTLRTGASGDADRSLAIPVLP
ncbi:MAG: histidine phosphatase family protein [Dokdonella sp.]